MQTAFPQAAAVEYSDVSPSFLSSPASSLPSGPLIDGPLYPGMHPEDIRSWLRFHSHVLHIAHTTPSPLAPQHGPLHRRAVTNATYPHESLHEPSMSVADSIAVSQVDNINEVLLGTPGLPPGLLDDPTPDEMAIHSYVNVAWGQPESEWHLSGWASPPV